VIFYLPDVARLRPASGGPESSYALSQIRTHVGGFTPLGSGFRRSDERGVHLFTGSEEEIEGGLDALERARELRQSMLKGRKGKLLPSSWKLIRRA
jgi:hypothetical protein